MYEKHQNGQQQHAQDWALNSLQRIVDIVALMDDESSSQFETENHFQHCHCFWNSTWYAFQQYYNSLKTPQEIIQTEAKKSNPPEASDL